MARYNGPINVTDRASALAVDAAGNVYVTGESFGSGTSYDYATVKYDAGGNQLWVARYNGPDNGEDRASALAVDAVGNVYVTGKAGAYTKDPATMRRSSTMPAVISCGWRATMGRALAATMLGPRSGCSG